MTCLACCLELEVLKLVLQELDQLVLTPDAEDDSVEVVGWLVRRGTPHRFELCWA